MAEAESLEAALLEAEHTLDAVSEALRQSEVSAAANRERIAVAESTIEHERSRCRELQQEIERHRRHLAELRARAGGLRQQVQETGDALGSAEEEQRQVARRLGEGERRQSDLLARLDQLRAESQSRRAAQTEQVRALTAIGNHASALESQAAAALAARDRTQTHLAESTAQLDALAAELKGLAEHRDRLGHRAQTGQAQWSAAADRLEDRRHEREGRQADLVQLQHRHSALAERIAVLEELEKRFEGLSPGVKDVMTLARQGNLPAFRQVRGLVADLLRVSVEAAPLVEVALGETAQHLVVGPGSALLEHLQAEPYQLTGRVGFLWFDPADAPTRPAPNLDGKPGVLGRADRFVETEPEYEPLARRLLGRTWLVERLADAVALSRAEGRGMSFVTLSGEHLAADGTLGVGPRHASSGLISRRSELRTLRTQLAELAAKVTQAQAAVVRLDQQIVEDRQQVETLAADYQKAAAELAQHGHRITAAVERRVQLDRQRELLQEELAAMARQHDDAERSLAEVCARKQTLEADLAEIETQLGALADQLQRLEADRQTHARETIEAKVDLAKSEERLRNLRTRMRQFEETQQERQRAIAESQEELAQCTIRAEQSERQILRAEAEVAELYLQKESFGARTAELFQQRESSQAQRSTLNAEAQRAAPGRVSWTRKSTSANWPPTRCASNVPPCPIASATIMASNWHNSKTPPPSRNSTNARKCRRRSTSFARRSTASAT